MGNFTPGFSTWCGSSYPYFSHTILETLSWCVGLTLEREFILPQGTNCQNSRELSGKRICSDTERRARNPVEGSEISETIARRSVKDSLAIFSESSRTN
nr:MAG TPA: hypothetical protein [Caudoviricetes sp.]